LHFFLSSCEQNYCFSAYVNKVMVTKRHEICNLARC
jgi:hypothetical protein